MVSWWLTFLVIVTVLYLCGTSAQHVDYETVCEWEDFSPRCGAGQVVVMESALYGRMRPARCIEGSTGGCQADVLDLAHRKCSGRQSCDVTIPDPEFDQTRPCGELRGFFEGSYSCLSVLGHPTQTCSQCDYVPLTTSSGFISKQVTMDTGCGTADCPWMIEAKPGQRITVSLHDFYTLSTSILPDVCKVYAVLREPDISQSATICGGSKRSEVIYISTGYTLEVRILSTQDEDDSPFFLLHYQVEGCPDLVPPSGGWIERSGDVATIGCHGDGAQWSMTCNQTEWLGSFQNCSKAVTSGRDSDTLSMFSFSYAETIAIIIAIAVVIGMLTVTVGVICLRRSYPNPQMDGTAVTLGYPIDEGPYNSGTTVPYYNSPHPNTVCHDYQEVSDNMVIGHNHKYQHEVALQSAADQLHRVNDYIMTNRPLPLPADSDVQQT